MQKQSLQSNLRRSCILTVLVAVCIAPSTGFAQSSPDLHPAWRPVSEAHKKTPKWLTLGTVYRFRVEGRTGLGFRDESESYGLGRLHVNIGVQPAPWMK